ncbi:MAG: tRNA (N(6)-L-threonylcarbamoyladenosine(37)-C(2))-methylthiotransferase MtaB [Paludibacteraceae bacterium]|nr:tRNA (N(6)-L-threonylcarbamoyladenosine(37)-C(2))-methylthiotransferase MtaB [Paludibacteraceae bacterium]
MTFIFSTLGCKLNFAETSALGKALVARGHTRATKAQMPDLCVINTCSVTDAADHKDRQAIRRLRRQYPSAILVVTGCYAQLKPGEVARIPGVDYVLGMNEKFSLPAFVEQLEQQVEAKQVQLSPIREIDEFHGAWSKDDRTRCFLKVQDGCNYFCTYCTIPLARGKSRNPEIAELVAQARQALGEGAKEIVLTGVNIGDFGRSTGEQFIDLLRALDQLDGYDYRLRISSCEPNLLSDEIIDFVAGSRHFAPHFHIPLQSGSNEVLKIMHRRYTRELFAERVAHIRRVMPNAFIGVDCMVGVRGETQECWEDYKAFITSLDVSQLHVFTYSERQNTRMLEMDLYVVPQKERERRSQELHRISEAKLQAFYDAHRGEEATVLWESGDTRTEHPLDGSGTLMSGWTENYIRVSRPYDSSRINTFEHIRL